VPVFGVRVPRARTCPPSSTPAQSDLPVVAVLVAFTSVQDRSTEPPGDVPQQVRTCPDTSEPQDEHLESVLGATPHEFESRILRPASPGCHEGPDRETGRGLRRSLSPRCPGLSMSLRPDCALRLRFCMHPQHRDKRARQGHRTTPRPRLGVLGLAPDLLAVGAVASPPAARGRVRTTVRILTDTQGRSEQPPGRHEAHRPRNVWCGNPQGRPGSWLGYSGPDSELGKTITHGLGRMGTDQSGCGHA